MGSLYQIFMLQEKCKQSLNKLRKTQKKRRVTNRSGYTLFPLFPKKNDQIRQNLFNFNFKLDPMGRKPKSKQEAPSNNKTKQIKKSNEDSGRNQGQAQQILENHDIILFNPLVLSNQIDEKLSDVSQLFQKLSEFGYNRFDQKKLEQKVRVSCQKAGKQLISRIVNETQASLNVYQGQIFKGINQLEDTYTNLKSILEQKGFFNQTEIDSALTIVDKKIEEKKDNLNSINSLIEKGNLALDN